MKTASAGVKKLLMYLLVLVCVLFVAFIAYYFARNDEVIALSIPEGQVVYLNKGDSFALPIIHTDPDKDTKIEVSTITDKNVVNYSDATRTFVAAKGGMTSITITTTNRHFGPFRFDFMVGEGSVTNPYYVSDALQLQKIGKNPLEEGAWLLTDNYQLINDINLSSVYTDTAFWTPIGSSASPFAGKFNGSEHKISNLIIKENFDDVGLFGYISGTGSVEGLVLENVEITGTEDFTFKNVGIVAGQNHGKISRIVADGKINAFSADNVGGIAGKTDFSIGSAEIYNSSVKLEVKGTVTNFGGITAYNQAGVLFNCKSELILDFDSAVLTGGIVAENKARAADETYIYTRPILKNCYTIINSYENAGTIALIVGKNTEATNSYAAINRYVSNYGFCTTLTVLCGSGKSTTTDSEMKARTKEELQDQENFADWSFDDIWKMDIFPSINIEAGTVYHGEYIPGSDLTSKSEVETAILKMISNPELTLTYTVNTGSDIVIDCKELLENQKWVPIGTEANPFKGKLVVLENSTLTLKNIEITDYYANTGFFGFVDGTVISNVAFENIRFTKPESTESSYCGVVVGQGKGNIEKCTINDAILTNYDQVGFVAGKGSSLNIVGCNVDCNVEESENKIEIKTGSKELIVGGIIGNAVEGIVKDCTVTNSLIKNVLEGSAKFGGIVGSLCKSNIENCANTGLNISSIQGSESFYGGIVGKIIDASKVISCYNLGKIEVSASNDSYVGGIAAFNSKEGVIQKSFSNTPKAQGKYVGGVVSLNDGLVTECYSEGEYLGNQIGGLAYYCNGTIANCYTLASVVGTGYSDKCAVAGLVAFLPEGGTVKFCFSSAAISGDDSKLFAETSARIRYADISKFFNTALGDYKPGVLTNCVVINYGEAEVQKKFMAKAGYPFIECSEEDCKGETLFNPFEKAEFLTKSVGLWNYEIGEFPTLVNVVKVPSEPVEE